MLILQSGKCLKSISFANYHDAQAWAVVLCFFVAQKAHFVQNNLCSFFCKPKNGPNMRHNSIRSNCRLLLTSYNAFWHPIPPTTIFCDCLQKWCKHLLVLDLLFVHWDDTVPLKWWLPIYIKLKIREWNGMFTMFTRCYLIGSAPRPWLQCVLDRATSCKEKWQKSGRFWVITSLYQSYVAYRKKWTKQMWGVNNSATTTRFTKTDLFLSLYSMLLSSSVVVADALLLPGK